MHEMIATPVKEIEQKFLPLNPDRLDRFRIGAVAIEQAYLSHPDEPFSLRLRKSGGRGAPTYSATLKDTGVRTNAGLERIEIEAPVSAERFDYYNDDIPNIRKLRAQPHRDVVIDFFENGHVHAESEHPESWRSFVESEGLENEFVDVTGSPVTDNERIAHDHYAAWHGRETVRPAAELNVDTIVDNILFCKANQPVVVLRLTGRSGSGKTTVVNQLRDRLAAEGLTSDVMSTDDYNRGSIHQKEKGDGTWYNFDADEVYDIRLYRKHLLTLSQGYGIQRRQFDPVAEEPVITGFIRPVDVIICEGIKAGHPDLRQLASVSYELPTPLATAIGRRITRDLVERPRFADPSTNLAYYLEYAEPEYRAHA